ncbi:antibiotic biosynthesis monooxygenase [Exiguobacterium sp. BRG2]|uniref:antibiotic biosynthesis monooxygenase n=1 Tax=Exiguobacterium sp. BRG2 TaxID=2962584 RepID=UPI002882C9A9|nr:antibiotic biosynthesis monooxygenase [Exiguobacterium sp. BRG2]MDT0172990.1 antibiotic biosynthesis monooxygenase [Exiguobacterium sp. BRG2]
MMYGLWTTFTTQNGQRDNVIALLLEAAASLATHPGCLHYIISRSASQMFCMFAKFGRMRLLIKHP